MELFHQEEPTVVKALRETIIKEYSEVLKGTSPFLVDDEIIFGTANYFNYYFDAFVESLNVHNEVVAQLDFNVCFETLIDIVNNDIEDEEMSSYEAESLLEAIEDVSSRAFSESYPDGFSGIILETLRQRDFFFLYSTVWRAETIFYEQLAYENSPLQEVW